MKRTYSAESVCCGHPDKIADLISDTILDECLADDPNSRVACEVMLAHNKCFISGEITTKAKVDYVQVAKNVMCYVGLDPNSIEYECRIHEQSGDISQAVNKEEICAGDQSIVYGYAIKETKSYMPLPIVLAHRLAARLEDCRRNRIINGLLPDGKALVSVDYEDKVLLGISTIVISAQHEEDKSIAELRREIKKHVIDYVCEHFNLARTAIFINPSGRFVLGGFEADTGLTGRKIIVDTYGGRAHHGGGAFSGKDASKVDRSGAYLARYIAKNIVASGLAKECEITLTYAIGQQEPVNVDVNTFGTGDFDDDFIVNVVKEAFDLSVDGSIKALGLTEPIYCHTSVYGHFGKTFLPWEKIDKVNDIKEAINKVRGYEQLNLFDFKED